MAESKQFGNRRCSDDLKRVTDEQNALTYTLEDQPHFVGTEEELRYMQSLERCYIDGYPKVSDEEWDVLKARHNYRESLVSTAPSSRTWLKLMAPLPSIDKAGDLQALRDFLNRWPHGTTFLVEPKMDGLCANIRYDLEGDHYVKRCVCSRGNGRYGLVLHEHALDGVEVKGIPETIDASEVERAVGQKPQYLDVRGEAVIPLGSVNGGGCDEPVVWRSVVSGMWNRKVPANISGLVQTLYGMTFEQWMQGRESREVEVKDVRIFGSLCPEIAAGCFGRSRYRLFVTNERGIHAFNNSGVEVRYTPQPERLLVMAHSISLDGMNYDHPKIRSVPGFCWVDGIRLRDGELSPFVTQTSDHEAIIDLVARFYGCDANGKRDHSMPRYRNLHECALDGIVIKVRDTSIDMQGLQCRNSRGGVGKLVVPKYPEDAIACKLLSEMVRVKLERIESTTTTLGNVTLRGVLDRAYLTESGAYVSSVNLHNPHWLEEHPWVREGAELDMVMAMDILPQFLPPFSQERGA